MRQARASASCNFLDGWIKRLAHGSVSSVISSSLSTSVVASAGRFVPFFLSRREGLSFEAGMTVACDISTSASAAATEVAAAAEISCLRLAAAAAAAGPTRGGGEGTTGRTTTGKASPSSREMMQRDSKERARSRKERECAGFSALDDDGVTALGSVAIAAAAAAAAAWSKNCWPLLSLIECSLTKYSLAPQQVSKSKEKPAEFGPLDLRLHFRQGLNAAAGGGGEHAVVNDLDLRQNGATFLVAAASRGLQESSCCGVRSGAADGGLSGVSEAAVAAEEPGSDSRCTSYNATSAQSVLSNAGLCASTDPDVEAELGIGEDRAKLADLAASVDSNCASASFSGKKGRVLTRRMRGSKAGRNSSATAWGESEDCCFC